MFKKFLENVPGKWQDFPFDIFATVFVNVQDEELNRLYKDYRKVNCIAAIKDSNYELQIVVPSSCPFYLLFLFDNKDDTLLNATSIGTQQKFPLLKHRTCNRIDYEDYVVAQLHVNKLLNQKGLQRLEYNFSPEGKSIFSTKESEEELKTAETYTIIELPAEVCPETVEEILRKYESYS